MQRKTKLTTAGSAGLVVHDGSLRHRPRTHVALGGGIPQRVIPQPKFLCPSYLVFSVGGVPVKGRRDVILPSRDEAELQKRQQDLRTGRRCEYRVE